MDTYLRIIASKTFLWSAFELKKADIICHNPELLCTGTTDFDLHCLNIPITVVKKRGLGVRQERFRDETKDTSVIVAIRNDIPSVHGEFKNELKDLAYNNCARLMELLKDHIVVKRKRGYTYVISLR